MKKRYLNITVYIDTNGKLLGVPYGKSKKYDIAGLDLLLLLDTPYSLSELEDYLLLLFKKCFSETCKDDDISSIEKYYNVKGYVKATKILRLVGVDWLQGRGYEINPTKNMHKYGFQDIEEQKISLPTNFSAGELAGAFLKAMEFCE